MLKWCKLLLIYLYINYLITIFKEKTTKSPTKKHPQHHENNSKKIL
jgi:hypothetical protein